MQREEIEAIIRAILTARSNVDAKLDSLSTTESLYEAGMTSHATVKVMLSLEDAFDVEFPDELLERSVFDRIESIADAIEKLQSGR
jgi:acyl carrier protein